MFSCWRQIIGSIFPIFSLSRTCIPMRPVAFLKKFKFVIHFLHLCFFDFFFLDRICSSEQQTAWKQLERGILVKIFLHSNILNFSSDDLCKMKNTFNVGIQGG